jgi:hypothetical protein
MRASASAGLTGYLHIVGAFGAPYFNKQDQETKA